MVSAPAASPYIRPPARSRTICRVAPADIRRIRESLSMSQAVFAAFLGVDAGTVRSWEQGLRTPSGMARRFLQEVEAEPKHWRKRIAAAGKVEKAPREP